ncbi:N-6 DNA methylase [uncultured Nonlabens sp.]|uniref:Eco57I restriction-modification methylase domain-containing protein n=1 Tax=uncultured Nonlabens sp. TaxID=859306 RepID=UPI00261EE739|nr:N-6 DNA methylase [uncultured Nonlabens sp.]
MPIFQPSVLKSHIALLDHKAIDKAYKQFANYFLDPKIQENIKVAKEEQYQATFLTELFVKIFGYTLFPDKNHNLVTEQKNEGNSRKADGAILKGDAVTAVIELKGTKTKDLESIRKQAFDYKNFNTGCNYVITSNFEKLRFYIDDASNFEEFDLFSLSRKRFELLYLCINKEQLLQHTPKSIKEESLVEEEKITKSFYKDYSLFKRELWKDLAKNNVKSLKLLAAQHRSVENEIVDGLVTEADDDLTRLEKNVKRTLFKKSQKLIDRFLFIFFAEDRGLLQPNYTLKSIEEWETVRKLGVEESLYDRFKKHFNYLDQGRKKTDGVSEIFAYNGGLFKPDTILDHIIISDDLLLKHTKKIAAYDFESQVDVNILGHIFENSLNEIESVNAEIDGADFDKQTSKRKKDGVFYTPKYITKYIVDNTVGKLCEEKKTELGFDESEYYRGRKNRNKSTLENLVKILDDYREWLLQLTICDPACGSGAFLNQALDFLITEHNYIDELKSKLLGGSIALSDIENTILENNIYGVDLNEESVEIAKLSLWLRTAQPRRKLNDLSSNIKCGNSLIDVKAVAGDKAFKWEEEFPQVFAKGGFDVVIGNPPYVDIKALDQIIVKELFKKYKTAENRINLYSIFIERGFDLIKSRGYLSFINPNSILINSSYTKIRSLLIDHMSLIVKLPDGVFKDAIVETIIFEFRKDNIDPTIDTIVYSKNEAIEFVDNNLIRKIDREIWKENESINYNIFVSKQQLETLRKIEKNQNLLGDLADFTLGITPYDKYRGHSKELIKNREFHSRTAINHNYKPLISGSNISRYLVTEDIKEYIYYGEWLGAAREERFFTEPRIIVRQIVSGNPPRIYAGFSESDLYFTQIGFSIIPNNEVLDIKILLAILNSTLINFYHKFSFLDLEKELFQKILIANCKKFPLPDFYPSLIKTRLISKTNEIIELTSSENSKINKFIDYLVSLTTSNLTRKLQNWHELAFGDFIKELNKAIKAENRRLKKEAAANVSSIKDVSSSAVENESASRTKNSLDCARLDNENKVRSSAVEIPTLTKKDEFEWMELFEEKKKEVQELQSQINQTEKEIDQMVYELYGLSDEEIAIVEES